MTVTAYRSQRQRNLDAKVAFLDAIAMKGARLAEGAAYRNSLTPVQLICHAGHLCSPTPNAIQQGKGLCRTCVGLNPAVAEAAFWASVAEAGGKPVLGASYWGKDTPVQLVCAQGHSCNPTPGNVRSGHQICYVCSRPDARVLSRFTTSETAFWVNVSKSGATPAPGATYEGKDIPVALICAEGHDYNPTPANLRKGHGCGCCSAMFDRVYLLAHPGVFGIKVGVSSQDHRVKGHLQHGYQIVTEWRNLEHAQALAVEQHCIAYWRGEGWPQVDAAPKDGRTETTSSEHLPETLVWLAEAFSSTHPQNPTR